MKVKGFEVTPCQFEDFAQSENFNHCAPKVVDLILAEAFRVEKSKAAKFLNKYHVIKFTPTQNGLSTFVLVDTKDKKIYPSSVEFSPKAKVVFRNKTGLLYINGPKPDGHMCLYNMINLGSVTAENAPIKFSLEEGYPVFYPVSFECEK